MRSTENSFVRILSQPRHPSPVPPAQAIGLLEDATHAGDHVFWSRDLSVLSAVGLHRRRIHSGRHLTDVYLLALAIAHGRRLVTLDRTIPTAAVASAGAQHLTIL